MALKSYKLRPKAKLIKTCSFNCWSWQKIRRFVVEITENEIAWRRESTFRKNGDRHWFQIFRTPCIQYMRNHKPIYHLSSSSQLGHWCLLLPQDFVYTRQIPISEKTEIHLKYWAVKGIRLLPSFAIDKFDHIYAQREDQRFMQHMLCNKNPALKVYPVIQRRMMKITATIFVIYW